MNSQNSGDEGQISKEAKKIPPEVLFKKLQEAADAADLHPGDLYVHYKALIGKSELTTYQIVGFSVHADTLQYLVTYKDLKHETLFSRRISNFIGKVALPDGNEVLRFQPAGRINY